MPNRPVHFEIHAADPTRCAAFYSVVFGWKFTKWDGPMPYWIVDTGEGDGVNGGMLPRQGPPPADGQPVNSFVMTLAVESLDATLETVATHGGTEVVPKMAIPGVGWLAYVKDPEGNILGMMEHDEAASSS
jgi:predicted enzyme related to lactoylglutathione lyase